MTDFPSGPILHVDMDAFFAAVECLDFPELAGQAVVVGAPPDKRGVVSTASYEARVYGIHSAMPSRTAAQRCPQAVFRPVRMARYAEVSAEIMDLVRRFTPRVEQVSVDEAFLDVSGVWRRWPDAAVLARALKQAMRDEVGLTASVGVAPNKFLAKLASDLEKPDGLTVVPQDPDAIRRFLAPLPVKRIWGVGPVTEARLKGLGLSRIGQIQDSPLSTLETLLGPAAAAHLQALAFGRDDRRVEEAHEVKSLSAEHTFDTDCGDPDVQRRSLIRLVERVGVRVRAAGLRARVGHLKLRTGDFRTKTRQQPFARPTCSDRDLLACALQLFDRERGDRALRLLGFGVSGFEDPGRLRQGDLFEAGADDRADGRDQRLDEALDRLRARYGREAIGRGGGAPPPPKAEDGAD